MAESADKRKKDVTKIDAKKTGDKTSGVENPPWEPQKNKDTITINKNLLIIVSVIIIIAVIAAVAFVVLSAPVQQDTRLSAKYGDTVSVLYIGRYENNSVFDTNIESIAEQAGLQRTTFEPLEFTIGENQVIAGFEAAVIGMQLGKKKTVTLEPSQAYGEYDQQRLVTIPRIQELNRTETYNTTFIIQPRTFNLTFGKSAVLNDVVTEPQTGLRFNVTNITVFSISIEAVLKRGENITWVGMPWNSTVIAVGRNNATLRQNPVDGQVMETYLGESTISVTEEKIRITANPVAGTSISTPAGPYLVKAVTDEFVTLDSNHPLAGKRLVFEIELLNITAAPATS